ncbi:MAG: hypothetical protein HC838_14850 [Spirulinaceae cyanobacterium RM2_2_10]|nr:hypothetical protein [Spirulinaceae cyanobacterium SM2_1_0]NJO21053.1 hypothetical protein [Spirulinaceae cyanobacterium RM2_2_10]
MNLEQEVYGFTGFTIIWLLLALLTFGLLNWLHVPTGNFLDWSVGAVSFWWLTVIATVPWNIYFSAKAVLNDAVISREKGIDIDERQMQFVDQVQKRMLWVALGLHVLSAIALYLLAATGISAIGYLSSGAALLLTGLRPTIALYRYLMQRLVNIGRELKYPREDIVALRDRVQQLVDQQAVLTHQLDPEESSSWVARQQRSLDGLQQDLARLGADHERLQANNERDHERLALEARSAIAQLSEDSQFLDRVREIIRFFKQA